MPGDPFSGRVFFESIPSRLPPIFRDLGDTYEPPREVSIGFERDVANMVTRTVGVGMDYNIRDLDRALERVRESRSTCGINGNEFVVTIDRRTALTIRRRGDRFEVSAPSLEDADQAGAQFVRSIRHALLELQPC